jgi:predicted nucleic acid-binding Zn ribbon protein
MSDPEEPGGRRGADLAREALAAARKQNEQRRSAIRAESADGWNPKGRRPGGPLSGRRRSWSGSGNDPLRDPSPLGATLRGWLKSAGSGVDLAKATLFGRWAEIVGAEIAEHCRPISLVDGELLVQAESTAWATQLRMLGGTLAQRINAEVGRGTVKRVRAQGPSGPSWRFGPRHVPGRGPRDTYG